MSATPATDVIGPVGQVLCWSTDTLPTGATDAERIAAWAELASTWLLPIQIEYDAPGPFWMQATIATLRPLVLLELRGCGHRLTRIEPDPGTNSVSYGTPAPNTPGPAIPTPVLVNLQLAGHSTARGPGERMRAQPGNAGVLTSTWPRFIELPDNFHQRLLLVPVDLLRPPLGDTAAAINRILPATPATSLLSSRVGYLVEHADELDAATARLVRDQLIELLALAVDPTSGGTASRRQQRLHAIHQEVEHRLTDPTLCSRDVADTLQISVRHLQALLTAQGTSFTRLLAQRRVQRARAAFDADPTRTLTVAQIARHYGFTDRTRFSKLFTLHVGMSPSAYRSRAVGRPDED